MISLPITLDGVTYPHIRILSLKRSAAILDGPLAGRVMTGEMERDIIGTYYNYSTEVWRVDYRYPAEYDSFYDVITAPVNSHILKVPYGQTTLTFKAYVSQVDDELLDIAEDQNRWGNMSFNFIAMAPQRTPT